jgi:hypothetical protein
LSLATISTALKTTGRIWPTIPAKAVQLICVASVANFARQPAGRGLSLRRPISASARNGRRG